MIVSDTPINSQSAVRPVILLSGPPGAGKSSVAEELKRQASTPAVCIEGDCFWSFIIKENESLGRKKTFRTITASMIASAVPFALNGFEVIIDFSISPRLLPLAKKVFQSRNIPIQYVVLLATEKTCADRVANREEGKVEDYASLHDFFLSFREDGHHIVDTECGDIKSLARQIRSGLNDGRFLLRKMDE